MGTNRYNLPLISGTTSAKVPRDVNALANSIDSMLERELNRLDNITSSLGTASPKGIYPTTSALATAKPTGDTHIYIISADGKWYYWNGTVWTAGGVYQATGLADGSVTDAKVKDVQAKKISVGNGWTLADELSYAKEDFRFSRNVSVGATSFKAQSNVLLKVKNLQNTKLVSRVPDIVQASIFYGGKTTTLPSLLQGEKMDENVILRKWRKVRFKELSFVYMAMDNSNQFYRLHATLANYADLQNNSAAVNVIAQSANFTAISQVESGTFIGNSLFISSINDTLRIKVSAADFQASGFATIDQYVASFTDFDLYFALKVEAPEPHTTVINVKPSDDVTASESMLLSLYAKDSLEKLESNTFKRFETEIENPLNGIGYTEEFVQIRMSFKPGECADERQIVIKDESGVVYPHQWEDDRSVNLLTEENIGRYNDNALKAGTIWIKTILAAGTKKRFYIDVYQKPVNVLPAVIKEEYSTTGVVLEAGVVKLHFHATRKMTLSNVTYNNADKYATATDVLDLRYKDTASTYRRVSTDGVLENYQIKGSGVHFKDFTGTWTLDNKFRIFAQVRLFANEQVEFRFRAVALADLPASNVEGVEMSAVYPISATRTFYDIGQLESKITGIEWTENNKKMFIAPYYAQGDIPRDDGTRPQYPASNVVAISNNRAIVSVGWYYATANTRFDIAKNEVFSGRIVMDLKGFNDTANDETKRLFNPLVTRATDKPIILNEKALLQKLIDWIHHVDYNYVETYNPSRLFYPYMSKFILWKFKGIGSLADQIAYFKETINQYFGGGTQAGLINAYKTTTSAGYQISSRIIPMAKHFRDEAVRSGDTANQTYMETLLKAYAELSAQLVEQYGFTPLLYTTTEANSNSTASGLKALSMGLDLDPTNTRWQNAYNTNLAFLLTLRSAENILQETAASKIQKGHYLHYATYTLFDYLQSTKHTSTFKPMAYMWQAMNAMGQMKEYEYCISSSRRGLGHTSGYMVYALAKERTPYAIEQAHAVVDNMIRQAFPNGGHMFPVENLKLQSASTYQSSAAFEMQAYGETILMLSKRV